MEPGWITREAASRDGNVYITVFGKIMVYNARGKLLKTIAPASLTEHYEDVVLLADGSLMAVSRGENIIHLTTAGKILDQIKAAISTVSSDPELDSKIAVDEQGNIYVLGVFNNAVFVFDAEGKYETRFGSSGEQPGQFTAPTALAVDGKGRIFVSDIKGVQVFSNDGRYIDVIKVKTIAFGLAFDDQDKLNLTTNQAKVERYIIP